MIDFVGNPMRTVLPILLQDKSTKKHIIWAADPPDDVGAKLEKNDKMTIWHPLVPEKLTVPAEAFFSIGFTHHRTIISKVKDMDERIFYIKRCAEEKYSREARQ